VENMYGESIRAGARSQVDSLISGISSNLSISPEAIIALSGNTGYTTGPHLHFAIQTNTQQGVKSIKFRFGGVEPLSGTYLSN
jgi:hypothetical protein